MADIVSLGANVKPAIQQISDLTKSFGDNTKVLKSSIKTIASYNKEGVEYLKLSGKLVSGVGEVGQVYKLVDGVLVKVNSTMKITNEATREQIKADKEAVKAKNALAKAAEKSAKEAEKAATALAKLNAENLASQRKLATQEFDKESSRRVGDKLSGAVDLSSPGTTDADVRRVNNAIGKLKELVAQGRVTEAEFDRVFKNIGKDIDEAYTGGARLAATELNKMRKELAATGAATKRETQEMKHGFENIGLSLTTIKRLLIFDIVGSGLAAFTGAIRESAQEFGNFTIEVAQLQTLSQESSRDFGSWADEINRLSEEFGKSRLDVSRATYQALSNQVIDAANSQEFMNTALEASTVFVSTAEDAVNLLSAAVNAYGRNTNEAKSLAATFFTIIDEGRVEAEDLADSFGQIAAPAASLGIALNEIGAAFIAITRQGVSPDETLTLIRNTIFSLLNPSQELLKVYEKNNIASSEALLAAKGYGGALQFLQKEAGGSIQAIREMFGTLRGTVGVLAQSGKQVDVFNKALDDLNNQSLDKFNNAANIVLESVGTRLNQETNALKNTIVDTFGEPIALSILEISEQLGGLENLVGLTAGAFVAAGTGIGVYTLAISAAAKASASASVILIATNPVLAGIAAAAAVAGLAWIAYEANVDDAAKRLDEFTQEGTDKIQAHAEDIKNLTLEQVRALDLLTEKAVANIAEEAIGQTAVFNKIQDANEKNIKSSFDTIEEGSKALTNALEAEGKALKDILSEVESSISTSEARIKELVAQAAKASADGASSSANFKTQIAAKRIDNKSESEIATSAVRRDRNIEEFLKDISRIDERLQQIKDSSLQPDDGFVANDLNKRREKLLQQIEEENAKAEKIEQASIERAERRQATIEKNSANEQLSSLKKELSKTGTLNKFDSEKIEIFNNENLEHSLGLIEKAIDLQEESLNKSIDSGKTGEAALALEELNKLRNIEGELIEKNIKTEEANIEKKTTERANLETHLKNNETALENAKTIQSELQKLSNKYAEDHAAAAEELKKQYNLLVAIKGLSSDKIDTGALGSAISKVEGEVALDDKLSDKITETEKSRQRQTEQTKKQADADRKVLNINIEEAKVRADILNTLEKTKGALALGIFDKSQTDSSFANRTSIKSEIGPLTKDESFQKINNEILEFNSRLADSTIEPKQAFDELRESLEALELDPSLIETAIGSITSQVQKLNRVQKEAQEARENVNDLQGAEVEGVSDKFKTKTDEISDGVTSLNSSLTNLNNTASASIPALEGVAEAVKPAPVTSPPPTQGGLVNSPKLTLKDPNEKLPSQFDSRLTKGANQYDEILGQIDERIKSSKDNMGELGVNADSASTSTAGIAAAAEAAAPPIDTAKAALGEASGAAAGTASSMGEIGPKAGEAGETVTEELTPALNTAKGIITNSANEMERMQRAAEATVKALEEAAEIKSGGGSSPQKKARGGWIDWTPHGTDTVPVMMTPGEFVVNARSAKQYRSLLEQINSGRIKNQIQPKYLKSGGPVTNNETVNLNVSVVDRGNSQTTALSIGRELERLAAQGQFNLLKRR